MRRFRSHRGHKLTPANDPTPAPFGAFAPNAAQAAIIRLAQRSRLERGAVRPVLSRPVDFLRAHTPAGGVFVDVGANVGTYAMVLARHVGANGKVITIEPHPVTHARLAFNRAASGCTQVILVAAAAGPSDGELMIETDGDNLGASHIVSGEPVGNAIKVPSLRLQ